MQWVKPTFVAQIRFVEWTGEGRLRHRRFLGCVLTRIRRMSGASDHAGSYVGARLTLTSVLPG